MSAILHVTQSFIVIVTCEHPGIYTCPVGLLSVSLDHQVFIHDGHLKISALQCTQMLHTKTAEFHTFSY